jgi:hypothetical protein
VKLPILKPQYCTLGWIASIGIGIACLVWRVLMLPGWPYSTSVFLITTTVILALFAGETNKQTTQVVILTFVVGTGIILLGSRFDNLMYGLSIGRGLLPINDDVGLISGLLWVIPVFTSLSLSNKISDNLYVRSLIGAVLVLTPSLFMLLSAEGLWLFSWIENAISVKVIIIWFILAFFLHFVANQMGAQKGNPIAIRLYYVYVGYFFVAWLLDLFVLKQYMWTPM